MHNAPHLVIRPARASDQAALQRLAQLDSTWLDGAADLVAEQCGRLVAALMADGRAIANPFEPTAAIVAFMQAEGNAGQPRFSRRYWRANPATNAGL